MKHLSSVLGLAVAATMSGGLLGSSSVSAAAGAPAVTRYAYLTAVDPSAGTVTYDRVDFFLGPAAHQACVADGEPVPDMEWCNDFYIRNTSPRLRTARVTPSAALSLVSPDNADEQQRISLRDLGARHGERLFALTLKGGAITRITQQFLP